MNQRQGGGGWFDGNNKQFNPDGLFHAQYNNNQEQQFGGNNNGWRGNQSSQRGNLNNNFWASRNNDNGFNSNNNIGGNNNNNNFSGNAGNFNSSSWGGNDGGFGNNNQMANVRNFNNQNIGGGVGGGGNDNFDNQRNSGNMNRSQNFRGGNRGSGNSGRGSGGGSGSGMEKNSNNFKRDQQIVAYPNITGIKLQKTQIIDLDECEDEQSPVSQSDNSYGKIKQKTSQPLICFEQLQTEKLDDAQKIIQQISPKKQRTQKESKQTAVTPTAIPSLDSIQKRTSQMADLQSETKSFKIPKLTTVSIKNEQNLSIPTPPPPPKISSIQENQINVSKPIDAPKENTKTHKKIVYEYSNNILKDSDDLGYRIITETETLNGITKTINVQTVPFSLLNVDEQQIVLKRYLPFIDNHQTNDRKIQISSLYPTGICVIDILDPKDNETIISSKKKKFCQFKMADQYDIICDYIEKDKLTNVKLYTSANIEPIVSENDIIMLPMPIFEKHQLRLTILRYCDERGYEIIKRDTKLTKILYERLINASKNTKIPSFTYVGVLDNLFRVNCVNSETRIWLEENLINWTNELYEFDDEKMAGNTVTNFSLVIREQMLNMKKINFVITADNPKSWPIMSKRIKIQNPLMSPDKWITEKIEPFMEIGVKYYFYVPNNGIKCNPSISGAIPTSSGTPFLKLYFGLDSLIINME